MGISNNSLRVIDKNEFKREGHKAGTKVAKY